tara:strand:+ start:345 stop:851 length:507 start_codon:yes stop_codon:yes gene_type:complete
MKKLLEVILYVLVTIGLLSLCSCEKEEVLPDVCPGGCEAFLELPSEIDENGYYHIDLSWDGTYYPRFSINTFATPTGEFWHYNGVSVVQANFYTDTTWEYGYDVIPIVAQTRVYLSKNENIKELYGKRIVGPFPPEMEGDTINIKAVIFWDAGINYLEKEISIDFIVE